VVRLSGQARHGPLKQPDPPVGTRRRAESEQPMRANADPCRAGVRTGAYFPSNSGVCLAAIAL
jgi:hypothetical protein